jgi:hypothetical protein
MAQPHRTFEEKPLVIGSPVSKGLGHASEKGLRDRLAGEINFSANAAHKIFSILDCRFSINRLSRSNHNGYEFFSLVKQRLNQPPLHQAGFYDDFHPKRFVLFFSSFSSIRNPTASSGGWYLFFRTSPMENQESQIVNRTSAIAPRQSQIKNRSGLIVHKNRI